MEITPKKSGGNTAGCFLKGCLGCSVGCGGLMLAMVIGCVFLFRWMFGPNPMLNATTQVGTNNRSFVLFHLDPANPGQRAMLLYMGQVANKKNAAQQQNFRNLRQNNGEGAQKFLPQVSGAVTWTYQDDKLAHYAILISPDKMRGLVRFMMMVAHREDGTNYQGWRVTESKHQSIADQDANFVLSDDTATLHQAIDRTKSGTFSPPADVKALYDKLNAALPCVGVVDNGAGELATVLPKLTAGPNALIPLRQRQIDVLAHLTRRLGFQVDIVSEDAIAFKAVLDPKNPKAGLVLQHILERVAAQMKAQGQASDTSVTVQDGMVDVEMKLTGVEKHIDGLMNDESGTPEPVGSPDKS